MDKDKSVGQGDQADGSSPAKDLPVAQPTVSKDEESDLEDLDGKMDRIAMAATTVDSDGVVSLQTFSMHSLRRSPVRQIILLLLGLDDHSRKKSLSRQQNRSWMKMPS